MLTRIPRDRGPQGPRGLPTAFGGARCFAPRSHETKKQIGFPTVILGAETEHKNKQKRKQTGSETNKNRISENPNGVRKTKIQTWKQPQKQAETETNIVQLHNSA